MAGVKISALPAAPSAQLTDVFPAVQGGVTYKETNQQLIDLVGTTIGPVLLNPTGDQTITGAHNLIMATGQMQAPIMQMGQINDTNGNEMLQFFPEVSAVNYFTMINNATGQSVSLESSGADTNVSMTFVAKNAGQLGFYSTDSTAPIQFFTGTAKQHGTLFSFANTNATRTVTWPDATMTVAGTALSLGGTNNNLTASNGGIVWSDASKLNILSGTSTAQQLLLSGASATPQWSTTTYPLTNAINTIMYASSANVLGVVTPTNNGVLVYSGGGVPSSSTTLPTGLAMQTPLSITLTNGTGLPISTGVSGLGTNVATILANNAVGSTSGGMVSGLDSTWVPVLAFGGASTGIMYSTQTAQYSTNGNTCTFSLNIALSNKGSSTGTATISLPIAGRTGIVQGIFGFYGSVTYTGSPFMQITSGATTLTLNAQASGSTGSTILDSDCTNTSIFYITGTYLV